MVGSIIPPPIHNKVEKTYVSSKDPHHQVSKDKKDKKQRHKHDEPKDTVELSSEENETEQENKKYPDSPMKGHIDITV
jgi:hypothetical protein